MKSAMELKLWKEARKEEASKKDGAALVLKLISTPTGFRLVVMDHGGERLRATIAEINEKGEMHLFKEIPYDVGISVDNEGGITLV